MLFTSKIDAIYYFNISRYKPWRLVTAIWNLQKTFVLRGTLKHSSCWKSRHFVSKVPKIEILCLQKTQYCYCILSSRDDYQDYKPLLPSLIFISFLFFTKIFPVCFQISQLNHLWLNAFPGMPFAMRMAGNCWMRNIKQGITDEYSTLTWTEIGIFTKGFISVKMSLEKYLL